MADIVRALDAALRARYPKAEVKTPITQRRGLTARMGQLEKKFSRPGDRKGVAGRRAAKEAGISLRTWEKWRKGDVKSPSPRLLGKLEDAYNRLITVPKLRRKVTPASVPTAVNVSAAIVWNGYTNQKAHRTVKFTTGVQTVMAATIRAWAHEGPEAAALAFQAGLATQENVPNETGDDGELIPGIQFDGDTVEVYFP